MHTRMFSESAVACQANHNCLIASWLCCSYAAVRQRTNNAFLHLLIRRRIINYFQETRLIHRTWNHKFQQVKRAHKLYFKLVTYPPLQYVHILKRIDWKLRAINIVINGVNVLLFSISKIPLMAWWRRSFVAEQYWLSRIPIPRRLLNIYVYIYDSGTSYMIEAVSIQSGHKK